MPFVGQGMKQVYPILYTDTHGTNVPLPHTYCTSFPELQISVYFVLQSVFEVHVQAILRQVHQMSPKMTLNTKRSKYPIITYYVLLVFPSPKFQFVSFYNQPILSYRPFWDKCTEWPINDPETYKVKGTPYIICIYALRVSQSHKLCFVLLSTISHFQQSQANLRQVHWMAPNDIEHYTVNDTLDICY